MREGGKEREREGSWVERKESCREKEKSESRKGMDDENSGRRNGRNRAREEGGRGGSWKYVITPKLDGCAPGLIMMTLKLPRRLATSSY